MAVGIKDIRNDFEFTDSYDLVNKKTGEVLEMPDVDDESVPSYFRVTQRAGKMLASLLKSSASFSVLMYLSSKMGYFSQVNTTIANIVKDTNLSRPTVYRAIMELYEKGLIVVLHDGTFIINPGYIARGQTKHIHGLKQLFLKSKNLEFRHEFKIKKNGISNREKGKMAEAI